MRSFQLEKETGEKVRKACEVGRAQDISGFPCSLSATYLILPASSFLKLCFPWKSGSSEDAGSILQDVLCFPCITFCFHSALSLDDFYWSSKGLAGPAAEVSMSPAHPSQFSWAGDGSKTLQSHLLNLWRSCLLAEMRCLALCGCCWGCCNTESNKFAWTISQSSYIRYWKIFLRRQLSYWTAVLLCSFLSPV